MTSPSTNEKHCSRRCAYNRWSAWLLVLSKKIVQSRGVRSTSVDSLLMITILAGIALSVVNLILALVNGRSKRMAEIKANAGFRELYQRTYKRGRRLVSRTGKTGRPAVPGRPD